MIDLSSFDYVSSKLDELLTFITYNKSPMINDSVSDYLRISEKLLTALNEEFELVKKRSSDYLPYLSDLVRKELRVNQRYCAEQLLDTFYNEGGIQVDLYDDLISDGYNLIIQLCLLGQQLLNHWPTNGLEEQLRKVFSTGSKEDELTYGSQEIVFILDVEEEVKFLEGKKLLINEFEETRYDELLGLINKSVELFLQVTRDYESFNEFFEVTDELGSLIGSA